MRIAIDGDILTHGYCGVRTYLDNLLRVWYLNDLDLDMIVYSSKPVNTHGFKNIVLGRPYNLKLMARILTDRPAAVFCPNYIVPYTYKTPVIATIHDITFKALPEYYDAKYLKYINPRVDMAIKTATRILTDSEHSKQEIIKHYNRSSKVIPLGVSDSFEPRHIRENKDILFVGAMFKRRHVEEIIKAYKGMNIRERLVLIGSNPHGIHIPDGVYWSEKIDNWNLKSMYQNAVCFITLPEYDGFCLPALEAMACGCPIVTTDLSCMPEVCGEAGIYVDYKDVKSIQRGIITAITKHSEYKTSSIKRANRFTWIKTAGETLKAIMESIR